MEKSIARKTSSWPIMLESGLKRLYTLLVGALVIAAGCQQQLPQNEKEITVAAAANLTDAFDEMAKQFSAKTSIRVVYSFGSTAELTTQIENGGPFDVFASADVGHIDKLDQKGLISPDTRAIYAVGRLVLWVPQGPTINRIEDVARDDVRTIAIAKPDLAPYGQAAVETLKALNLWTQVEPKVVYGTNVSNTKQYATSGNAQVAFIPLALLKKGEGQYIEVDERLHQPINQALAVIKASSKPDLARQFVNYVLGDDGRAILGRFGYSNPSE